jgi:hypothetical protein
MRPPQKMLSFFFPVIVGFVLLVTFPHNGVSGNLPAERFNISLIPRVQITQIHQFEKGAYVENISVRSNSNLLVTRLDTPEVYEINPSAKNVSLVHKFKGYSRVSGIVEIKDDIFAV